MQVASCCDGVAKRRRPPHMISIMAAERVRGLLQHTCRPCVHSGDSGQSCRGSRCCSKSSAVLVS